MSNTAIYNVSICLTDIPTDKYHISQKNGKTYVSLSVAEKKEKDQFDKDVSVWVTPTKEEREADAPRLWCGSGKKFVFENQTPEEHPFPQQEATEQSQTSQPAPPPTDESDLPF